MADQGSSNRTAKGVVVTGGAGDLGAALVDSFAADGFAVYAGDVRPVPARDGVVPVELDVTDRDAVFALARRAGDEAGLAVWVNNAGVVDTQPVAGADPGDWERIIAINLSGVFHGCAAALEVMAAGGGGRIVNVGSISGQVGGVGLHPAYGASKAGVHALTKTYALEGTRHGIYCNAVAPFVLAGSMGAQFGDRQEKLMKSHPMRRFGTMDEAVHAVRYLADPRASFTNGAILQVNGGALMIG